MFSAIKDNYRKSQAAVMVQELLELNSNGRNLLGSPAALANVAVGQVWDQKPELFGGKRGQRPHNQSVAAIALAHGMVEYRHDTPTHLAFGMSLSMALREIERNPFFNVMNWTDGPIIEVAQRAYLTSYDGELPSGIDREKALANLDAARRERAS
jgi:hypothetical protein